jgi:HAE1 family hydrophobic/amphiphilic exporter-1
MRIWIDPDKAAGHDLTAGEIVLDLRAQNVQVPPARRPAAVQSPGSDFELNINTQGRLTDPDQFANIILKNDAGGTSCGCATSPAWSWGPGLPGQRLPRPRPEGRRHRHQPAAGLERAGHRRRGAEDHGEPRPGLPARPEIHGRLQPHEYVAESIKEVRKTLFEAVLLVVLVVVVFLQTWRAAIIPVLAIPVSLIGAFAVMAGLRRLAEQPVAVRPGAGDRHRRRRRHRRGRERRANLEAGMSPKEAAYATMDEVGGALIAIALVLVAVFVPTAVHHGISGQFYKQFALTIASATVISCMVSLTLSPAMAALVLRPKPEHPVRETGWKRPFQVFGERFNAGFSALSNRYGEVTSRNVRRGPLMVVIYIVLLAFTVWRFMATPTGFIPAQDQGYSSRWCNCRPARRWRAPTRW